MGWAQILKSDFKFPFHMYNALREMYYGRGIEINRQPREDLEFMKEEIKGLIEELNMYLKIGTMPKEIFIKKGIYVTLTDEAESFVEKLLGKIKISDNLKRGIGDIVILEY